MNNGWLDFLLILNNNIEPYLVVVTLLSVIYYLIYKRIIMDVFDPFFLNVLIQLFAASVAIFMYANGQMVKDEYIDSFILNEIFIIAGVCIFGSLKENHDKSIGACSSTDEKFKKIYDGYIVLAIISYTLQYITLGIPLFSNAEHTAIFYGGNGIYSVINGWISEPLIAMFFIRIVDKTYKKYEVVCFIYIFVCMLMSGSKGVGLSLVAGFFYAEIYFLLFGQIDYCRYSKLLKKIKNKIIILVIVSLVIGFAGYAVAKGTETNPMIIFLYRLVACGDLYAYFYATDFSGILNVSDPFLMLIGNPFAAFGVISYDSIPLDLGGQIKQAIFNTSDFIGGANSRPEVLGYALFGVYGGAFFCFLAGFAVSIMRSKRLIRIWPKDIIGYNLYIIFYGCIIELVTDPILSFRKLAINIVLLIGYLLLVCYMVPYIKNFAIKKDK